MRNQYILFFLLFAAVLITGFAVSDTRADTPTFGGKECVTKCCDKASGAREYTGCKTACEKAAHKDACLTDCSQKMQKAYQSFLIKDCKMDKDLASMTIRCNK